MSAMPFRHLSASRPVTIAQIEGRVRGAGGEFVLACDMRFAAPRKTCFPRHQKIAARDFVLNSLRRLRGSEET